MAAPRDDGALLIMGGGRMGEALLSGLLAAGRAGAELVVAEVLPSRRKELAAAHPGVAVVDAPVPVAAAVLAVKPGDVADAARAVADAGCQRVLSVAAGVTTKAIEAAVGGRVAAPPRPRSAPARRPMTRTWRGPSRFWAPSAWSCACPRAPSTQ
jgi:pyrroline-5-carboxylate reductase